MKPGWADVPLLLALLVPACVTAEPQGVRPSDPPYYSDARFDRELAGDQSPVTPADALPAFQEATGASLVLPGFALGADIRLAPGRRRIRDLMDALADGYQGQWKKVKAAYVLVIEPRLLDIAELKPEQREKAGRDVIQALVATLTPPQVARLEKGQGLTVALARLEQRSYFAELGALGYYDRPWQRHPKAIRGEGLFIEYGAATSGPELRVWLPVRKGKPELWLKAPLRLPRAEGSQEP